MFVSLSLSNLINDNDILCYKKIELIKPNDRVPREMNDL